MGSVCVLQLWDDDLGALWACPMDKCECHRTDPSSLDQEWDSCTSTASGQAESCLPSPPEHSCTAEDPWLESLLLYF